MKVALISETFLPQINGIVRTIERVIHHLEDNGHEAILITLGEGDNTYSKTPVIRIPGLKFSLYEELHLVQPQEEVVSKIIEKIGVAQVPVAMLQSIIPTPHPIVEKALKDFDPDIIHLVTPATLGAVGYYYVENMNKPCLSTFHTDLAAYTPNYQLPYLENAVHAFNKFIYNRTDRVLAPSPSSKAQLDDIGVENVGVFGRGVNNEMFNPSKRNPKVWEKYGLNPNRLTVLYVGRLAEEKSLPILIEAFKSISETHKLQIALVGDGPARPVLEAELQGTKHVFTGIKKGEELAELYASADIFGFPSKTETFGQVVLEAMSSGLPVVGFDSQGVRDLVNHKETGFLAKADDFESYRNYLHELVLNDNYRESFGQNGRKEACSRSWKIILDSLLDEYQGVIDNKKVKS